tara:strand:- start:90 stop:362 length:273 start_codon:yes stop_codon:yes gene_type:complete
MKPFQPKFIAERTKVFDILFGVRAEERGYDFNDVLAQLKEWNKITQAWDLLWQEANQGRENATDAEREEDFHLIVRMKEVLVNILEGEEE